MFAHKYWLLTHGKLPPELLTHGKLPPDLGLSNLIDTNWQWLFGRFWLKIYNPVWKFQGLNLEMYTCDPCSLPAIWYTLSVYIIRF